jgi:uncharacterized protein (DUF3084 family)
MNKVGFIAGIIVFVISAYFLVTHTLPNYFEAQEELKAAQKEYDAAVIENEKAQQELRTVINEERLR